MAYPKSILIVFSLILIIFSSAQNLNCKYTAEEEYFTPVRFLVYEGTTQKAGDDFILSGFTAGKVASFLIKNPNNFRVMVVLNYTVKGVGANNLHYGKWINANDEVQIREMCRDGETWGECSIDQGTLIYSVDKPSVMYPKEVNQTQTRTICLRKELGVGCSSNTNCDSDFCVRGYCSSSEFCYQNDCKCGEGQTQCSDNKRCVPKDSLEIGSQPICSAEECKTRYLNADGLCDKRPIPLWFYMVGVGALAVLVSSAFLLKAHYEKEKRKRIEKEIEKLREEDAALARRRMELEELEKKQRETEKLRDEIAQREREIEERKKRIEEMDRDLVKIRQIHGKKYWRNPKYNYYPCWVRSGDYKTDILIHRDVAENEIYNNHSTFFEHKYPNQKFKDLVVHHIDKDPDNFHNLNLVIITQNEHNLINHKNIPMGNRDKGISELLRLHIVNPHINELQGR